MLPQEYIGVYDKFADDIFQHCYLKVSNRDKAKDILQNVFYRAWEYVKDNAVDDIKKFLIKTADNLIQDRQMVLDRLKKPIINQIGKAKKVNRKNIHRIKNFKSI